MFDDLLFIRKRDERLIVQWNRVRLEVTRYEDENVCYGRVLMTHRFSGR